MLDDREPRRRPRAALEHAGRPGHSRRIDRRVPVSLREEDA
jgi:hypothetical protein